jgi:hypothetical protein
MNSVRLGFLLMMIAPCLSCSSSATGGRQPEASSYTRIQSIPAADPARYRKIRDYKEWRNPYLVIRKDGVGLLDIANNEQRLLDPHDLPDALALLPPTAWPYGRVVRVAENSISSPEEGILIRKNRGIVQGTLESMHVLIDWVPSA